MSPAHALSRRGFLRAAALGGLAAVGSLRAGSPPPRFPVHLFSKHLQFLTGAALAEQAAALGFDGVDLTVRPGGHVGPDEVDRDLPPIAAALRAAGLPPVMCTTAITTAEDPATDRVLGAVADAGFTHVRLGWHRFPADRPLPLVLESLKPVAHALAAVLRRHGLRGAFQNHAGAAFVGASVWELQPLVAELDPQVLGLQFDIRHAAVERGLSWTNEFNLAAPHLVSIALKDFRWSEDPVIGRGTVTNVPLGEGWVDWAAYAALLRRHAPAVPASLHYEYDLGGAEHGHRELTIPPDQVYAALRRDLQRARALLA